MSHPRDNELIQIGTLCIWTRPSHRVNPKVVKVKIVDYGAQSSQGGQFLNYYVEIVGESGKYAAYHGDLQVIK